MAANYQKSAKEISRLLFLGTEWNVESMGGGAGDAQMRSRIVRLEIPKIWPSATAEQLSAIAARLPVVNYLRDDRTRVAKQIEAALYDHIGTGARKKRASSPKARSKTQR